MWVQDLIDDYSINDSGCVFFQKAQQKAGAAQEVEPNEELKALTCSALKQHCDNPAWNRAGRKHKKNGHSILNQA